MKRQKRLATNCQNPILANHVSATANSLREGGVTAIATQTRNRMTHGTKNRWVQLSRNGVHHALNAKVRKNVKVLFCPIKLDPLRTEILTFFVSVLYGLEHLLTEVLGIDPDLGARK